MTYAAPTRAALAALLRRHAQRAGELAAALAPDLSDAEREDPAREAQDLAQRTAMHRMVLDLEAQVRRCELSAGLVRRADAEVVHAARVLVVVAGGESAP